MITHIRNCCKECNSQKQTLQATDVLHKNIHRLAWGAGFSTPWKTELWSRRSSLREPADGRKEMKGFNPWGGNRAFFSKYQACIDTDSMPSSPLVANSKISPITSLVPQSVCLHPNGSCRQSSNKPVGDLDVQWGDNGWNRLWAGAAVNTLLLQRHRNKGEEIQKNVNQSHILMMIIGDYYFLLKH